MNLNQTFWTWTKCSGHHEFICCLNWTLRYRFRSRLMTPKPELNWTPASLDAIKVFNINFFNPGTKLVRRSIKSSLEELMAHHWATLHTWQHSCPRKDHATCWKDSMASDDLDMIRLNEWPTVTYLSSSRSCKHILLKMRETISVWAAGGTGMVVVEERIEFQETCYNFSTPTVSIFLYHSLMTSLFLTFPWCFFTCSTYSHIYTQPHPQSFCLLSGTCTTLLDSI